MQSPPPYPFLRHREASEFVQAPYPDAAMPFSCDPVTCTDECVGCIALRAEIERLTALKRGLDVKWLALNARKLDNDLAEIELELASE
jgi:hypothetical protein